MQCMWTWKTSWPPSRFTFTTLRQPGSAMPRSAAMPGGDAGQLAHQRVVLGGEVVERRDVAPRHDQHVDRGLGVDVVEGHHVLVLVDELGGDLLAADLAEEAVRHASPRSWAAAGRRGRRRIPRPDQGRESRIKVTGPSFTELDLHVGPEDPLAPPAAPGRAAARPPTRRARSPASGGAASTKLGRFPLRASPSSVNWETSSTPPAHVLHRPVHLAGRRPRRCAAGPACRPSTGRPSSESPAAATPSRTTRPCPTSPTTCRSTRTAPRATRCTTDRIRPSCHGTPARTLGPRRDSPEPRANAGPCSSCATSGSSDLPAAAGAGARAQLGEPARPTSGRSPASSSGRCGASPGASRTR